MPKGITVVGLGPGKPGLLTVEAQRVLQNTRDIYVRTKRHPTVEALPTSALVRSFDDVYEQFGTFQEVYAEIASRVIELGGREDGVVYAVPGHPLVGEASVQRVLDMAQERTLAVQIVDGLSFVEPVCTRLKIDALNGLQIADATELAMLHYPSFNPDLPVLLGQVYSRGIASDVKLVLMALYPDEHEVTLVRGAGTAGEWVHRIPLYELDRVQQVDHLTSLYVPPLPQPGSLSAFQEVVARLRAPGGCPWDREQSHLSLRPFLLEETYEVLAALDSEDTSALKDELGDLLLQILLHAQIAIEDEEFRMADVVAHILTKLKRRHPHVFGEVHVSGAEEVLVNWEHIKSEERAHEQEQGILTGVPRGLPALARAQSLQRRAARWGFSWPNVDRAWGKAEEEWQELRKAADGDAREAELGDLLFALVSLASWLHVDAESALRQAVSRFEQRFAALECACAAAGRDLASLEPAEWDELWSRTRTQSG